VVVPTTPYICNTSGEVQAAARCPSTIRRERRGAWGASTYAACLHGRIQYPRAGSDIRGVQLTLGILVLFTVGYLASPVMLIWGWLRWINRPRLWTVPSILSFAGFILATTSAVLAIASITYAQIHHFPYYDPLLLRIFSMGSLLSIGGVVLGVGGVWRPNSLRWHAPVSGACMLTFWIMVASLE
jgi:hypothetical protein